MPLMGVRGVELWTQLPQVGRDFFWPGYGLFLSVGPVYA